MIKESDYHALTQLIAKTNGEGANLGKRISGTKVVKDHEWDEATVRINSTVEVHDLTRNVRMSVRIVLPEEVDLAKRQVSVFAPLSVALLGQRSGDTVSWEMPDGSRKLAIIDVKNKE